MACPFPGMDPYLELQPYWGDFAPSFLTALSNCLLVELLPKYETLIDEHALPPTQDDPAYEPHTQRRLKIIHRPTEKVVTVMELLSPGNKAPGEGGLDLYLEKRAELLSCGCNLVELDLLRGGQRLPMAGQWPAGDYFAFIGRVGRRRRCQVIGWPLRGPLPAIPIPLLAPDPELSLDLQSVFRAAYEPAFYDRRLPYDRPLQPPLAPDHERWVREALTAGARDRSGR